MATETLTCPLCNNHVPSGASCHAGCPMSRGCSLVRCPTCGYEMPDPRESVLARWASRWIGRTGTREEQQ